MTTATSRGTCLICERDIPKNRMTHHVAECARDETGGEPWFHLVIQGRYAPEYWLHVRAHPRATLRDLDHFLRDIWLECCGHMSEFVIEGLCYVSDRVDEIESRGMTDRLTNVLQPGTKFTHTYDFGTSTELELRVVAERQSAGAKKKIILLARNWPPEIACEVCGAPARQVCAQCSWTGAGWFCDKCAEKHECGEEVLMPVVNSPRVGQCGYTG